ncbi:putative redox-active protein [Longilinea arvoryzae]|uniref:Putative redox-active protein n=1 Tax=Longilinea arvoryzae TaxID=360412 RepID=A0A0S7BE03_9CHLR|nr:DV_1555 family C-GCAxxG-C-C protein [Longilinea arvoryzae]GAP13641.1 putative redox-active protein [Longilinea arvoryzae]
MDDLDYMKELKGQGFVCSQILLKMGLELQGKDNPDLIRAIQGLAGGLGYTGDVCGSLSAGACLLGMYAGKGTPEDEDDPRLYFMIADLVKWFKQEYGQGNGAIHCDDIVNNQGTKSIAHCPEIVAATYQKVKDLLVDNGFDLSGMD